MAFYNSLSPTTKLLIQSFMSVLGSVLVGTGTAAYQSYTNAGRLDIPGLWVVTSLTFGLLFGKTMHDWVPAHAQQLLQSLQDEKTALLDALTKQQSISSAALATQGKLVQSTGPQPQVQPPVVAQPPVPPQVVVNTSDLAAKFLEQLNLPQLASLLKNELIATAQQTVKSPIPQQIAVSGAPTWPDLNAVRESTPRVNTGG